MDFFSAVIHTIESFLFPQSCLGECGTRDTTLCEKCAQKSPRAHDAPPHTLVAFSYEGVVKRAIHALKYENQKECATRLGELLWHEIGNALLEEALELSTTKEVFLIPIPISRTRLRERGYNQVALVARALARESGGSLVLREDVLYKIKDTESQVRVKDREKRLKNIAGSFELSPKTEIRGRICVLLDDVITTGATLKEARAILQKGSPAAVIAVAIAH